MAEKAEKDPSPAKCAGCGEAYPCSDSKRKDISGVERAKHHVASVKKDEMSTDMEMAEKPVEKNDYRPPMTPDVAAQAGRGGAQHSSAGPKLSTDFHMPTGPMPSMSGGNVSATPAAVAQKSENKPKLPRKSKGMK